MYHGGLHNREDIRHGSVHVLRHYQHVNVAYKRHDHPDSVQTRPDDARHNNRSAVDVWHYVYYDANVKHDGLNDVHDVGDDNHLHLHHPNLHRRRHVHPNDPHDPPNDGPDDARRASDEHVNDRQVLYVA